MIQRPAPENYEIRLIIWNTYDITRVDGDTVDMRVFVLYDPMGWNADEMLKETDIHYNSRDGNGEFNWRMKFRIDMPVEYPRIKIQIYDFDVTSDEAIGETTLNLRSSIKLLQRNGTLDDKKIWVSFYDYKRDQSAGYCLISF